jgi:hypothetical protein
MAQERNEMQEAWKKTTGEGGQREKRGDGGKGQHTNGKERYQRKTRKSLSMEKNYAETSVADPDPGSGAFSPLDTVPGFGIQDG